MTETYEKQRPSKPKPPRKRRPLVEGDKKRRQRPPKEIPPREEPTDTR